MQPEPRAACDQEQTALFRCTLLGISDTDYFRLDLNSGPAIPAVFLA